MHMKKRIMTLFVAVVMLLSLLAPAYAVESDWGTSMTSGYESTAVVDQAVLTDVLGADYVTGDGTVTQADVIVAVLRYAGMKDTQLSAVAEADDAAQFVYDCEKMAESMGMLEGVTYDADASCTVAQLTAMLNNNVEALYDALHADTLEPLFLNGMAQPIFEYSSAYAFTGNSFEVEFYGDTFTENERIGVDNTDDNPIVRFCVYVETNYDTDGDGKLDLVKALVQMPRAAMEGDYQAATIYEARPYITGCTDDGIAYIEGELDFDMYAQPAARVAAGEATTAEAVAVADADDWVYWNEYEAMYDFEDLDWYDYYLVRGYAVVECGGLGTLGSEGFETCGSDLEIDAFKCVIEWLHGDRVAYTDKENNIEIKADWSNGKVGMTGRSYAGTTQFALATTGVAGLETIVPVAGIASWYEYTNSQGVTTSWSNDPAYTDTLAMYCAGRYLDKEDFATIAEDYGKYLYTLQQEQRATNGDYGDTWAIRDYTQGGLFDDWTGIKAPALIVHGFQDTNVKTKQSDLMYQEYKEAGVPVKMIWHQGAHITPTYPAGGYAIDIGEDTYDSILNKWFSHYLYGVDNGIENMAEVTYQDNVDGSWHTADSWEAAEECLLNGAGSGTTTATASIPSTYVVEIPEDVTVQGTIAVSFRAKASGEGLEDMDGVRLTVSVSDTSTEEFMAYKDGSTVPTTTLKKNGAWMGGGVANYDLKEFIQTAMTSKSIGKGYIDLCNPSAGYDSYTAVMNDPAYVPGDWNEYTVYIQPTIYTVRENHVIEITIALPGDSDLTLTVDNASVSVELPTQDDSGAICLVALPFADVKLNNWYYDAVTYVVDAGIFTGMTANTFAPQSTMSRAMVATVLYNMAGSPEVSGDMPFTDVAEGAWYYDAVLWASQNGVVSGMTETTFAPKSDITREQMVSMLYRYANVLELDMTAGENTNILSYPDALEISEYAISAMQWACGEGVVSGRDDGTLDPGAGIKRCEAAVIMMGFDKLV